MKSGASATELLLMVTDFNRAATNNLQWDNVNTLFSNFRKQLEFPQRWDSIQAGHPRTVDGFNAAFDAFIATYFPGDAWEKHRPRSKDSGW
jgi:hypothetical protein